MPLIDTLYGKLIAVLLGFGAIMIAMTLLVMRMSQEAYQMEMNQRMFRPLAQQLASSDVVHARPGSEAGINARRLQTVREQLLPMNTAIEVYLLNSEGKVLSSSTPPETVKLDYVGLPPLQACMETPENLPILGDDPREPAKPAIFSVASLENDGYVYVTLKNRGEQDSFAQQLMKTYKVREGMWLATGGLAAALLASLLMLSFITRPLRRLSKAMEELRRGDFNAPPAPVAELAPTRDEIGRLGQTFDQMAERIHTQVHHLKEVDGTRRELVANISHDLRTPLASLQGYLETLLLKEQSLSAEEKRSYLEIAARQTVRLGNLVTKLFELTKLDNSAATLSPEPFMLSELAQDVVQKFSLPAVNKDVRMTVTSTDALPPVLADIGLMERVFENLLENALRHTAAGGWIEIRLFGSRREGRDEVQVELVDTGCGIPHEELPKIFDRFYRVEKSRTDAAESAGLGLAIVKRVLELHGSSIAVVSNVGAGTTFSFRLPAARRT